MARYFPLRRLVVLTGTETDGQAAQFKFLVQAQIATQFFRGRSGEVLDYRELSRSNGAQEFCGPRRHQAHPPDDTDAHLKLFITLERRPCSASLPWLPPTACSHFEGRTAIRPRCGPAPPQGPTASTGRKGRDLRAGRNEPYRHGYRGRPPAVCRNPGRVDASKSPSSPSSSGTGQPIANDEACALPARRSR
jgi:hypothetical protein